MLEGDKCYTEKEIFGKGGWKRMGERWLCFILNRMIKIDLPEPRVGGGEEMSQVGVGGKGVSGGGKGTCISEEVHTGQNSWEEGAGRRVEGWGYQ